MPMLTQPAFGPKLSIGFITGGTLLDVWMLVWRFTIASPELTPEGRFWFTGLLLTGATFLCIGLLLGNIGRAARKAEMPPTPEAARAEEHIQANAAARGVVVAPQMVPNSAVGAAFIPTNTPMAPVATPSTAS